MPPPAPAPANLKRLMLFDSFSFFSGALFGELMTAARHRGTVSSLEISLLNVRYIIIMELKVLFYSLAKIFDFLF